MNQRFDLPKEQKEDMMRRIQAFFHKEREEEIGDLAAIMVLDFIIDEIAPVFYNLGITDSHAFITDKLEDLFGLEK
ncbi:DUF2164 domain-containing protein [Virgibacillus sp. YIM 98842]|jgi:uncharacterized protein (DUF2164 family)|uniref:DUF2164 domain-containing protein n=1 Tax=Virgibacillus sp. YIM 98842 TaxID=2663533 RepID=UPI0013DB73CD|nr:DUF2164 domain-containing protein [Virgibacillus sp. YIM 98842]